jgi:hypothetical protein
MIKRFSINLLILAVIIGLGSFLALNVKADTSTDPCPGGTKIYYYDADSDGYGSMASTSLACAAPIHYVDNNTDCNDANASVHPGATEICNGIDDNCDGLIDEGLATTTYYLDFDKDGYGGNATSTIACAAPANYVANNTDCNDSNSAINPGKTEICNGIDDNCNGSIDEGLATSTFYLDFDNDGYGSTVGTTTACAAPANYSTKNTDCNDNDSSIHPGATETCDSIDNNCNGTIDERCGRIATSTKFYQDSDGDRYGNPNVSVMATSAPAGYVRNKKDCNDTNVDIHPGAKEICDQIDNNCNGKVDERCSNVGQYYQCEKYLFRNHGGYISCVSQWANQLKKHGEINGKEKGKIMKEATKKKFEEKIKNVWENFNNKFKSIKSKFRGR